MRSKFRDALGYQRTTEYPEEVAYQLDMDRAIERAVERDD
jgi:hypothetical protein